ncbi:hypothetical protein BDV59DRAFT_199691 [Aspergillus ambiguus]|uniref:uncharacterized protein n=1 Tax=Aspergillus ambiguus TaxID=176160 RepID=UPI003CCD0BBE
MSQSEEALRAFKRAHPAQFESSPRTLHWLIPHLIYDFDINSYMRGIRSHLKRARFQKAQDCVLKRLVSSYAKETECKLNEEEFDMAVFYFEGFFFWFLEYEKHLRAHGSESRQRKAQWRRVRRAFRYKTTILLNCYLDFLAYADEWVI